MQNHTLPTPLGACGAPISPASTARWARREAKMCIVFVHGYGGGATTTCGDFVEIAISRPEFALADLVFLDYESLTRSAPFNAGVIFSALKLLAENYPVFTKNVGAPKRKKTFKYKSLILVGHSLGAALVRNVAMAAKMERSRWAESIRLALFAPAHSGANILELIQIAGGGGLSVFLRPLIAAGFFLSPSLKDLEVGSVYLNKLRDDATFIGEHNTTVAKLVVHASEDRIVTHNTFFRDPPCKPYNRHGHMSCCKPEKDFLDPVLDVAGVIQCAR
jgi:pimeloyl-ACP methyl ester carboxylesterase